MVCFISFMMFGMMVIFIMNVLKRILNVIVNFMDLIVVFFVKINFVKMKIIISFVVVMIGLLCFNLVWMVCIGFFVFFWDVWYFLILINKICKIRFFFLGKINCVFLEKEVIDDYG